MSKAPERAIRRVISIKRGKHDCVREKERNGGEKKTRRKRKKKGACKKRTQSDIRSGNIFINKEKQDVRAKEEDNSVEKAF